MVVVVVVVVVVVAVVVVVEEDVLDSTSVMVVEGGGVTTSAGEVGADWVASEQADTSNNKATSPAVPGPGAVFFLNISSRIKTIP